MGRLGTIEGQTYSAHIALVLNSELVFPEEVLCSTYEQWKRLGQSISGLTGNILAVGITSLVLYSLSIKPSTPSEELNMICVHLEEVLLL